MARLFMIFLLGLSTSAIAQTSLDSGRMFVIRTTAMEGMILNISNRAQQLVKKNPSMVQVDVAMLKNRSKQWNYCNCYTESGMSFSYVDFGNTINLGRAITASAFTEPALYQGDRFSVHLRGGAGFAFLNKVYDPLYDSNNLFYSKRVSFLLQVGFNVAWQLSPQWRLGLASQFNHISNGGTRWPNWGMNTPMAGVSIAYIPRPQALPQRIRQPIHARPWKVISHLMVGRNTVDAKGVWEEEKKSVVGVNLGVVKTLGKISSLGVGGEWYYDGASAVLEERTGKSYRAGIGGIGFIHYFTFGKLLLGQQLLRYTSAPNPGIKSPYYQRYVLEYQIYRDWYAGVALKAHGNISDYITFSIGHTLALHHR